MCISITSFINDIIFKPSGIVNHKRFEDFPVKRQQLFDVIFCYIYPIIPIGIRDSIIDIREHPFKITI